MKKCLDLNIFGHSARNHTPNQTLYSSITDNKLFMLSCKWLLFNVNRADKIEYEIPQNIIKVIIAKYYQAIRMGDSEINVYICTIS
jgi:hypothetical protein